MKGLEGLDYVSRDLEAMKVSLAGLARTLIAQRARVPRLVRAGKLIKRADGWYGIPDFSVFDQISRIVLEMQIGEDGRLAAVKFEKFDMRVLRELAALAPKSH